MSAETTLDHNLIGRNSGNLLFIGTAYKLLATRHAIVEPDHFRADPRDADRINERYDVYVIPLANAFRRSFEPHLMRLTRLIEQLRIPVVILGVGAQSNLHYAMENLRPLDRSVKAFARAVLDRSPSIGVRGEFSEAYLRRLGFREVEVIGCPSMFLYGERLAVNKKSVALERDAKVSINVSPYHKTMGDWIMSHHDRYPNLMYIAQDLDTLALLLWGERPEGAMAGDKLPVDRSHPLLRENKVRLFIDPWPWVEYLRDFVFAFGTRLHGNIAALVAGTPAYVVVHDSRTLECARYFGIPHRPISKVGPDTDAAELYEEADFSALNRGHAERFARFAGFLQRHGLEHIFAADENPGEFDARVAATRFAPPVDARAISAASGPLYYSRRLRYRIRRLAKARWMMRLRRAAASIR